MKNNHNIKVVILCGGLGTRLREETEFRPKPMIEIGGKPIIWHIMKTYAYYGYQDFILCLGYKGEMIKEYFYNYEFLNNDFTIEYGNQKKIQLHSKNAENRWRITLADTGNRALKGARLKKIEKYIDGDMFMMTYGDGVANINIKNLLSFHQQNGKLATITGVNPDSRFGNLKINGNLVKTFTEKPNRTSRYVNGGFFVFNKNVFKYLSSDDNCDLEVGALEKLAQIKQLMIFKHKGFWSCMDTLRDVEYLNNLWNKKKAKWRVW